MLFLSQKRKRMYFYDEIAEMLEKIEANKLSNLIRPSGCNLEFVYKLACKIEPLRMEKL